MAAAANNLDVDEFMQTVADGNLEPWAARPVTLKMLLEVARSGGEPLTDVRSLYERGCRALLKEHPASGRSIQVRKLDTAASFAVAGRIACATVFGAHPLVSIDPAAGTAIAACDIAGDTELANGNKFPVGESAVQETLRTGLFNTVGIYFRWAHKSYAEFMAAWEAKEELRDTLWVPHPPAKLRRIVADSRYRMVRDEEDLAEAVWAALIDYQALIRDQGSRVMRLWNEPEFTPKIEEPISREIAHELQAMLEERGVGIACEPKIRQNQRVDIFVTVEVPGADPKRLSLVIEVKGCWHSELKEALETQLADGYLEGNSSRHGIYLVAWFLCDKWNNADSKKTKTPKTSRSDLENYLKTQAEQVNRERNVCLRPFVLDATIPGPASRALRHARARKLTRKK